MTQLYILSRPNAILYGLFSTISQLTGWRIIQRLGEVQVILVLSFIRIFLPNSTRPISINISEKQESSAYDLAVWDKIKLEAPDKDSDFNDVVLHSLTSIISY